MKTLADLLYKVPLTRVIGSTDSVIKNIQFDSRKINKNDAFVAVKGVDTDGHLFIDKAIIRGASAVILEVLPDKLIDGINYLLVEDSKKSLAVMAANFYNNPSEKIQLIGVTGTNGKTTIVHLLHQLHTNLGYKTGILSTINNKVGDISISSTHTTPDPLQINKLLSKMIEEDCSYCFMEVSSHAIHQSRIFGLHFSGGIFTNISHDHLDYHKTFENYTATKQAFFNALPSTAFALVNKDDKHGLRMLSKTSARRFTYSLTSIADYKARLLENQFDGMLLNINKIDIWVKLIGQFNAYNLLAIYATACLLNIGETEVLTALSMLDSAEGRFQILNSDDGVIAIVDYAHTEDALKNILDTINDIRKNKNQLITVIGCGGDRDKTKRPKMASVACNLSTQVILTTDNPRSEDPDNIIEDMISGLDPVQKKKLLVVLDRKQAIRTACRLARKNDIILVAGKGHEKYQEIKGKKFPFDDREELIQSLNII